MRATDNFLFTVVVSTHFNFGKMKDITFLQRHISNKMFGVEKASTLFETFDVADTMNANSFHEKSYMRHLRNYSDTIKTESMPPLFE